MKSMTLSACLLASVLPAITTAGMFVRNFEDTFDKTTALVAAAQPVDNTAGGALTYNAEAYFNAELMTNVQPNTPPNVIAAGQAGMLKEGQPEWYPMNSSILFFDQRSLAYACVTNAEEAAIATTCTIQVTGVRAADGITVVQELQYNPNVLSAKVPMNFTTFPITFRGLKSVATEVIQSPTGVDVNALIDSNSYTAYSDRQFTPAWSKYN